MDIRGAHVIQNGTFVNSKVQRVVEAIKDYEPDIDVEWVPPGARFNDNGDPIPGFKVVYRPAGQPEFTLFYVKDEEEFDEKVLFRIIHNDQRHNGGTSLSEYEAWEVSQKHLKEAAYREWLAEQEDKVKHVLATHLNTYKVDETLTIKDGIPFNANNLKD